jgi:hypothetical protein
MSDDQCWEDSVAQKEENDRNADAVVGLCRLNQVDQ